MTSIISLSVKDGYRIEILISCE